MAELSRIRQWFLLHFSQPAHYRQLFRTLVASPPRSLMELGVHLPRTRTLLSLTRCDSPGSSLTYVALDEFEARRTGPKLALKTAYRVLKQMGIQPRLLPGRPVESLPRWANHLGKMDLVLVWKEFAFDETSPLWFYIPRLLADQGMVWIEDTRRGKPAWLCVGKSLAQDWAGRATPRRAA